MHNQTVIVPAHALGACGHHGRRTVKLAVAAILHIPQLITRALSHLTPFGAFVRFFGMAPAVCLMTLVLSAWLLGSARIASAAGASRMGQGSGILTADLEALRQRLVYTSGSSIPTRCTCYRLLIPPNVEGLRCHACVSSAARCMCRRQRGQQAAAGMQCSRLQHVLGHDYINTLPLIHAEMRLTVLSCYDHQGFEGHLRVRHAW